VRTEPLALQGGFKETGYPRVKGENRFAQGNPKGISKVKLSDQRDPRRIKTGDTEATVA